MVALGYGVGYLVRLLAYSLCARYLVLVEGEEVKKSKLKKLLNDPKMQELYELAETVEISLMQSIDKDLMVVTAFVEYPDKRLILAISQGKDLYSVTLEALENAVERLKDYED